MYKNNAPFSGSTWEPGSQSGEIYYNDGNVGIGTNNPGEKLEVNGDGKFSGDLTVTGTISGSLNASNITGSLLVSKGGTGATSALGARNNLGLGTSNAPQFTRLGLGTASNSNFSLNTNSAMRIRATPVNQVNANGPERGVLVLHSEAGIGSNSQGGASNFSIEPSGNILTLSRNGGNSASFPLGCIFNLSRWEHNGNRSRSRLAFRLNHVGVTGDNETDYNTAMVICSNNSVGIGKTNPSVELDVSGDGRFSGDLDVEGNLKIGLDTEVYVTRFSNLLAPFDYNSMTNNGPIRVRILAFDGSEIQTSTTVPGGNSNIKNDRFVARCTFYDSTNNSYKIRHSSYGVSYTYFQEDISSDVNGDTMRSSDTNGNLGYNTATGKFTGRHENVFMKTGQVTPSASLANNISYSNYPTMDGYIGLVNPTALDDRVFVDKLQGYSNSLYATYMEFRYDVSFIGTYFGNPSANKGLNYESVFGGDQGNKMSDDHVYTVHLQCLYEDIGKVVSGNGGVDNQNGTDKERIRIELLDSNENYISTDSYEDLDFSRNDGTGATNNKNINIDVSGSELKNIRYIRFSYKSIVVNNTDGLPDQLATHRYRGLLGKAFISRPFLITDKTINQSLVDKSNTINNRVKFNSDINLNSYVGIGIENPEFPLHVVNSRNMMNHMITPYLDQKPTSGGTFNYAIYGDIGTLDLNLTLLRPYDVDGNYDLWSGMNDFEYSANPNATYTDDWDLNDDISRNNINLDKTAPAGISIYSYGAVYTKFQFITASDSRIKKNRTDISNNEALEILRKLKPCKYDYIDNTNRDNNSVYGFMAQEVKSVLNNSTKITREYIPNIYQKCLYNREENTLEFFLPVDIKFDEDGIAHLRISNYVNNNFIGFTDVKCTGSVGNNIYKIDPPSNPIYTFSISDLSGNFIYENEKNNIIKNFTFCFGQRVDDFHSLNKSAIWTITTAATQEIDRQLVDAKAQIETQKTQIETQKTQIETLTNLIETLTKRVELLEQN